MKKRMLVTMIVAVVIIIGALALASCAEVSTTVTYMSDGEVFKTVTVEGTEAADPAPVPEKSGYTFGGWYTDEAYQTPFDFDDYAANEERADITVYAKWDIITYSAKFVADGKTVQEVQFNAGATSVTAPAVPERVGYDGKWEEYELKSEDITINAVYSPIVYNVTYKNTEGASNTNRTTYTVENSDVTLTAPVKPGYKFKGWFADEEMRQSVSIIDVSECKDLTIWADWEIIEYTVNYQLDGGINNSANPSSYSVVTLGGADGVIPLEDPTKYTIFSVNADGTFTWHAYEFLGWYKDSGFEQRVSELSLSLGSVTLYAKWAASTEGSVNYVRVNENNELDEDGGYILFGQYPQAIKAADVSIISTTPDTDGYYLGSDGERYAKVVADPNESGYTFSNNSSVTSGNTYYFKVEPIRWRILSESDGNAFILCDSIIANHYYHHTHLSPTIDGQTVYANNYANSDIRAWLNDEFYNTAFGDLQQALIQTTEVDNSAASTGNSSNRYACENTFDKVFLLSYREVITIEYGFESSFTYNDTARRMLMSDFSRATGAYMSTSSGYYGNGWWLLRSPGSNFSYGARVVDSGGDARAIIGVHYDDYGVVPALNLTLS